MNIPTTFPIPELENGIFISGAGGGLNDVSTIPDGLCSTDEVRKILEDSGYIVDLRYKPSGITELKELFGSLDEMMIKRAECFVELAKRYESDFGFLAFRATTIVQYVAMSEIEMIIGEMDMPELGRSSSGEEREIHQLIKTHYQNLDKALEYLFEELAPENYILTADHAHVPFLKRANINPMLAKLGYQKKSVAGKSFKKQLGRFLPKKLVLKLAKSAPQKLKEKTRGFDVTKSKAFGHENIHGIYVNDSRRFNGPVSEGDELNQLVDEICAAFNADPEVKLHGMSAKPYRRDYMSAHFADLLPDIWIDRPEEIFFDGDGKDFVEPNKQFAPIFDLKDVPTDVNSGQKGKHPLFVYNSNMESLLLDEDPQDLTAVYRLTQRIFAQK